MERDCFDTLMILHKPEFFDNKVADYRLSHSLASGKALSELDFAAPAKEV